MLNKIFYRVLLSLVRVCEFSKVLLNVNDVPRVSASQAHTDQSEGIGYIKQGRTLFYSLSKGGSAS